MAQMSEMKAKKTGRAWLAPANLILTKRESFETNKHLQFETSTPAEKHHIRSQKLILQPLWKRSEYRALIFYMSLKKFSNGQ